jgi:hypothetical protein
MRRYGQKPLDAMVDSKCVNNLFARGCFGPLRDSVPSARRDWLPPDPLQAELSHDVDVVMDLSVYRSFDKLTHFLHPLI